MVFSHSDHDMLVPSLARAALLGAAPGDMMDPTRLNGEASVAPDKMRALADALTGAGLATSCAGGRLRRTGRPLRLYAIDLGGTKLHVALVDETGRILLERIEPTDRRGGHAVIDQIGSLCDALRDETGLATGSVAAAAMGSPGAVNPRTGRITMAPNIAGFDSFDVAGALRERLGLKLRIENDVNMAALGEQAEGAARGATNFALVAFGTGIGLGLVLNGALVRGAAGLAGEIAHMPIGADPFTAQNYRHGPLETAIGSAGLVESARKVGLEQVECVEDLFGLARAGNPRAEAVIGEAARTLFLALSAVQAIVDPELIVLAGGIGLQPEIAAHLGTIAADHPFAPRFERSALATRAAIAGAASCALAEALRPAGLP
jgi:predicted NBD/HSP70 family sugar kinase